MISYNLACIRGHEFEGWFKNSAAYDSQEATGVLCCPLCGEAKIRKAIMSPSVRTSATKAKGRIEIIPPAEPQKPQKYISGLRKFVEQNAEYVGPCFSEEARKIHYGDAEPRHIYGETTLQEAKELIEEGIDVAPLPLDPDELN